MKQLRLLKLSWAFVLWALTAFAQPGLKLGEATHGYPRARSLQRSESIAFASTSIEYLATVGGIAFDKVARPAPGLRVSSLQLNYDSSEEDGNRLSVTINGTRVRAPIYDWQLVPIAKYAGSPYYACFTLFGKLESDALARSVKQNGGKILNYHPELNNTLLGLRLFQLDILILRPDISIDLPKLDDRYILGSGEQIPDHASNIQGYRTFMEVNRLRNGLFRSYLICDKGRDVRFNVMNDTLSISGEPFYYFWRHTSDAPGSELNRQSLAGGLVYLDRLSTRVSNEPDLLRAINPAVWDAGVTTMRYAAFFRYCKANYPAQWRAFMAQVNRVNVSPVVTTPTVLYMPEN